MSVRGVWVGCVLDVDAIGELDTAGVLACARDTLRQRWEVEARHLVLAAHFADLNGPVEADVDGRVLAGEEEFYRFGGDGTPVVAEFAPAELGAVQGLSAAAATNLIADALDLRHRHPRLWRRVLAGEVPAGRARHVVHQTHHLGRAAAGQVDAAVTGYLTTLAWSRFCRVLEAAIIAADPATAEARRRAAESDRFRPDRPGHHMWVEDHDHPGPRR